MCYLISHNKVKIIFKLRLTGGSLNYAKITNKVPHFCGFSLCTCKWENFALVESLEQSQLHEFRVMSQNLHKAETLCNFNISFICIEYLQIFFSKCLGIDKQ